MKPDTTLTLGDFAFRGAEVPQGIAFGTEQSLANHDLVGGLRVVDSLGAFSAPLEWSGWFTGENALTRARTLDALCKAGGSLLLTWSELAYLVVIHTSKFDFQRFYQIPYSINCTVVADLSGSVAAPTSGIDEAMATDIASADSLSATVADSQLSSTMATLDSAIANVSSFAGAVQSTINSVLTPLAAVQSRVAILIASTGNTISNVTTLGGVLPNNPISTSAQSLLNQVTAMNSLPTLYNLQSVLGRMGANLGSLSAGNTLATAGGNLYRIAATQYGDATAWTTLARANNLTDPTLTGVQTLVIPPNPDKQGGILNA